MGKTDYAGIDYGLGRSNVDAKTGIRYGVISQHSIMPEATDDFEPDYGEPTCPICGNLVTDVATEAKQLEDGVQIEVTDVRDYKQYNERGCADYACDGCEVFLDSSEVFAEESQGFTYERDGYQLTNCLDNDVFVLASPFYTFAQFCSPCVPGAGNLNSPCEDGPKTYCLGHDWFEDGRAPYRVFRVADGTEVLPAAADGSDVSGGAL